MMNYLEFFDNKIKKYQNPSGPLPKDPEAFDKVQKLYEQDQPLSGTDPVGEFVVAGTVLSGPFDLAIQGISKGIRLLKPLARSKWVKYFGKSPLEYHKARLSTQSPKTYDIANKESFDAFIKATRPDLPDAQKAAFQKQLEIASTREGGAHTISAPGVIDEPIVLYNSKVPQIRDNYSQVISHEMDHVAHTPKTKAKGFDVSAESPEMQYYLEHGNNTELSARGSQLKDYYGFTKSTQKLTPEMLKYAQKHYIKDGNWDNNMTEFFRSIKNYDQAANWLSKESSMFALPLLMQKKND